MPEPFDPEIDAILVESLRQYAEFGSMVEVLVTDDACAACAVHRGISYDPTAAPPLPILTCTNDICRCDYSPLP